MCSAYVDRPGVETPNLERLADEGVLFENAFCSAPVCTPARSSWYTGLHPNQNGAWTNNRSTLREVPMLAGILEENGYPAFLKRRQCCSCAEAKRRSILILQVQADKADVVLAPLPEGEPVVSNGDYALCTPMNSKIWCKISLSCRL